MLSNCFFANILICPICCPKHIVEDDGQKHSQSYMTWRGIFHSTPPQMQSFKLTYPYVKMPDSVLFFLFAPTLSSVYIQWLQKSHHKHASHPPVSKHGCIQSLLLLWCKHHPPKGLFSLESYEVAESSYCFWDFPAFRCTSSSTDVVYFLFSL